jgi:hypothetical protein
MLTLGYFSKFPSTYKDREESVKDVVFNKISPPTTTEDNNIFIVSSTGKYTQEVMIQDENIHLNSQCKVFCSCESFKYEFANAIFRSGSLLKPIEFVRSIIKRPKEKNQYNIPSGCKHIVALSRQIIKLKIKK